MMEERKELDETEGSPGKGRIAGIVTSCILIVSVILCIGVCVQVLSKGYVSFGGVSLFRVVTGSMEPEIPVGSLLIAKETDISDIEIDDIVVFRSKESGMLGMVITHRVIASYAGPDGRIYLETKGDANQYADGYYVEKENLIGKAVFYGGGGFVTKLFGLLSDKVGFMACIVLPCLLFGMMAMRSCIKSLKAELEKTAKEPDETEPADAMDSGQQVSAEDEYEKLRERLRQEILEELKQGVGKDQKSEEQTTE